jgi:hypothetical protein
MTWLTWRQHRVLFAISAGVIFAVIAWMVVVYHDYTVATHALARCPTNTHRWGVNCNNLFGTALHVEDQAGVIRVLPWFVPALLGVLFGAPLVAAELERNTVILAFTQGISRSRWLVLRWVVVGTGVVALSALLAAVSNWWFGHVDTNASAAYPSLFSPTVTRIQPGFFDVTGIVPVAYTFFAFALGTALGAFFRKVFWGGLVTVVVFIATRVSFEHWVRPHILVANFRTGTALYSPGSGSWIIGFGYRHIPGSHLPSSAAYVNNSINDCLRPNESPSCLASHGIQFGEFYQPASHYWALQWGEAAAYVAAAAALFGLTVWAVRRWRA